MQTATSIARLSIGVGLTVMACKGLAWWLTGSAALYSDALETVVNVAASLMALYALRVADRPADREHPFGHAKAEFLAAGGEGALIVAAALSIFQHAWVTWLHPHALDTPLLGLALNMTASVINLVWAQVLRRTAAATRSPALAADSRHLMADVATGAGVAIGVALVVVTGKLWLDPVVAAATAIYVLWSGLRLINASVNALLDEAPNDATMDQIRAIIRANAKGAQEAHDLRTRQAGRLTFLEFHLVVPGDMRVAEADVYLHAPVVQSIARATHTSLVTASWIFVAVNFLILVLAIGIPVTRLFPRIVRKRSQTLQHNLEEARKETAAANARLSAVEAKLASLNDEIAKYRAEVEQEIVRDEARVKALLEEEKGRIVAGAEQEISSVAAQARRGLRAFAAELAVDRAASQLKLTLETDKALIAEFVQEVAGTGAARGGKN